VNDSVCEFDKITLIVSVRGFSRISFFFFLIELDYVIVYFFFSWENSFEKKKHMLLNCKKFIGLLMSSASLAFLFLLIYFFQLYPLILDWLRIEFHNLFHFDFYEVIIVLKKSLGIGLMLGFAITYFCYCIVK